MLLHCQWLDLGGESVLLVCQNTTVLGKGQDRKSSVFLQAFFVFARLMIRREPSFFITTLAVAARRTRSFQPFSLQDQAGLVKSFVLHAA